MGGEGREAEVDLEGVKSRGEYDQNTLYEILKASKYYIFKNALQLLYLPPPKL